MAMAWFPNLTRPGLIANVGFGCGGSSGIGSRICLRLEVMGGCGEEGADGFDLDLQVLGRFLSIPPRTFVAWAVSLVCERPFSDQVL
jgi:hypothetical protein